MINDPFSARFHHKIHQVNIGIKLVYAIWKHLSRGCCLGRYSCVWAIWGVLPNDVFDFINWTLCNWQRTWDLLHIFQQAKAPKKSVSCGYLKVGNIFSVHERNSLVLCNQLMIETSPSWEVQFVVKRQFGIQLRTERLYETWKFSILVLFVFFPVTSLPFPVKMDTPAEQICLLHLMCLGLRKGLRKGHSLFKWRNSMWWSSDQRPQTTNPPWNCCTLGKGFLVVLADDLSCIVRIVQQLSNTVDRTNTIFLNQNVVDFSFIVATHQRDFVWCRTRVKRNCVYLSGEHPFVLLGRISCFYILKFCF